MRNICLVDHPPQTHAAIRLVEPDIVGTEGNGMVSGNGTGSRSGKEGDATAAKTDLSMALVPEAEEKLRVT